MALKRLVLVGGGHAHASLLLRWCKRPLTGVELIVVSDHEHAWYSGMVPGWLAGDYPREAMAIPVRRLAERAGARWLTDTITGVDARGQRVALARFGALSYDLLSLNVGSTLRPPQVTAATVLSLRPLSRLIAQYPRVLQSWQEDNGTRPFRLTTVGGGAAGIECLLAILFRLRRDRPDKAIEAHLVTRSPELLAGASSAARRMAAQAMARAGVACHFEQLGDTGLVQQSDCVVWATGAEPLTWQQRFRPHGDVVLGAQGFIQVDATLRAAPQVYAAGDCVDFVPPLPKAGVYALRMTATLEHNLRAELDGGQTVAYRPQSRYLMLLKTGDHRAIAARGEWAWQGRWPWYWKRWIDERFVRRLQAGGAGTSDGVK